jgi:hypothetical protein
MAKSRSGSSKSRSPKSRSPQKGPKGEGSKKRTHKPAQGARARKPKIENTDQQGDRANIRQNQRNITRSTMR